MFYMGLHISEKHNGNIFETFEASLVVLGITSVKLHFTNLPQAAMLFNHGGLTPKHPQHNRNLWHLLWVKTMNKDKSELIWFKKKTLQKRDILRTQLSLGDKQDFFKLLGITFSTNLMTYQQEIMTPFYKGYLKLLIHGRKEYFSNRKNNSFKNYYSVKICSSGYLESLPSSPRS